jgi:alcohol dehydrogenase class IV
VAALDLEPLLAARLQRCEMRVVSGVGSGSPVSSVLEVRQVIRAFRPDTVIAVGGGSVIDTAKAACALASIDKPLTESDVAARWSSWPADVSARQVTLVAIPTTAGTGTEGTPYAVLSDSRNNKLFGFSHHFQPDLAVLIPDFVTTVPQPVAADLAMDAMAHAFEAFWSRRAGPGSDLAAMTAIVLLDSHLWAYYERRMDLQAARAVLLAATHAGEAFRLASSTACHALSFPLATVLGTSHGHACSLLLASIAQINLSDPDTRCKLEGLAMALRLSSAAAIPTYIREWGVRLRLKGAPERPQVAAGGMASLALQHMLENNPVRLAGHDIDGILSQVSIADLLCMGADSPTPRI